MLLRRSLHELETVRLPLIGSLVQGEFVRYKDSPSCLMTLSKMKIQYEIEHIQSCIALRDQKPGSAMQYLSWIIWLQRKTNWRDRS
jgi:hypothetical protein